jgi:two-component system response regulator NreC
VTGHGLRLVQADAGPPKGVGGEASVSVVLAENHPSLRRSLRSVLDTDDRVLVLAEASDLATATCHVDRLRPQVFLFDPWLLDQSGVEAVRCLREQAPSTAIVVLTMDESKAFAQQALAAGALGFVLKDTADSELPQAVRLAARGEGYTSPRVSPHLPGAQALDRRGAAPLIRREVLP